MDKARTGAPAANRPPHRRLHGMLEREQSIAKGEVQPVLTDDRTMTLLLEPDAWQREEQYLLTNKTVRHKVNPMLGVIVQHQFYDDQIAKAQRDGDTGEVIAKLFNVYSSGKVTKWITGDRIRPLQVDKRITDCRYKDGWQNIFVGCDFSHGDDLFAIAYLAINYIRTATPEGHIFADCDAWILEKTLNESPNKPLYEQWIKDGWLHVCPGEVFDSTYAINRIAALAYETNEQGDIDFLHPRLNLHSFGYDSAQSIDPINQLKAWLQTALLHRNPDVSPKELADTIQAMVIPVSQSFKSQTPTIEHIEKLIKMNPPLIQFSMNPLWPWCFGNCAVEITNSDLRRIVKGNGHQNKIDVVAALEDAMHLFDVAEGRVSE